ncbi:MAG: gamma-glutamyl-gamma-aminobutyrate hydrolase family protein [Spirochaetales bacterium]|nr:gamma-glutamyl-gamma-aminobutyrate hydrolase family protein [Spirochaetales bacterium]
MNRKPLIGITSYTYRDKMGLYSRVFADYSRSVIEAGGIPFILPLVSDPSLAGEYLDRIDGLLLSGGEDITPLHYGESPHEQVRCVNPARDLWELVLTGEALSRDMPLFGICRGHQMLNVACGGSLYQHVNGQKVTDRAHMMDNTEMHHLIHRVTLEEGTLLADCFDDREIMVNTFHNQAVKESGKGLVVTARSEDGIIEGQEMPGRSYVMSVQWHPEALTERHPSFRKLFSNFVEACHSEG